MQPRLSELNIWKRHEEHVCEVLAQALIILQAKDGLIQDENELNRALFFCFLEANRTFFAIGRGLDSPPVYDAKNQPLKSHEKKALREEKRPDFQWGFIDHTEMDPDKSSKWFCIECKRLGQPVSTWILNENYVHNGIVRFINEESGYAMEVESGAMVGYVESLDFDAILEEINNTLSQSFPKITKIELQDKSWRTDACNPLHHVFERPYLKSPFILKHFWIDVRGKLIPLVKSQNKPRKSVPKNKKGLQNQIRNKV